MPTARLLPQNPNHLASPSSQIHDGIIEREPFLRLARAPWQHHGRHCFTSGHDQHCLAGCMLDRDVLSSRPKETAPLLATLLADA